MVYFHVPLYLQTQLLKIGRLQLSFYLWTPMDDEWPLLLISQVLFPANSIDFDKFSGPSQTMSTMEALSLEVSLFTVNFTLYLY